MEKETKKATRNKEESKRVILDTAIMLLKTQGSNGFTIENLAKESGKSRRLIFSYYGNLRNILKEVISVSDYWISMEKEIEPMVDMAKKDNAQSLASSIFVEHLNLFFNNPLVQEVSSFELTKESDLLKEVSQARERVGDMLFQVAEPHFENTDVSIRGVSALLVGGINYLTLHNKWKHSNFCGIDLNNEEDFELLSKTIKQIVEWAYSQAKDTKPKS